MAGTMTLCMFLCGTGHSAKQEGLIQSAYGKITAIEAGGRSPIMGRLNFKAIYNGPGQAPVTANRFNRKLPGYKKAKKKLGGMLIGAGWDASTASGLEQIRDFVALGDAIGAERIVVNLVGHSRGSITVMRIINGLDAALLEASHDNPEGELLRGTPKSRILVNAYLNDPVGGPQGSGSRDACVRLPGQGDPHFFSLGCLRAIQMLVPRKRDDTKFYNDGVPELTASGFAPFDGRVDGACLIGETDAVSSARGFRSLQERTVILLPGTHGSAVDTRSGTPQSSIGTALMMSFLRRCGAGLRSQPEYTKKSVSELYADCQRVLYRHRTARSLQATRHPKRILTTKRTTELRGAKDVYQKRGHLVRANRFFNDPFLVNTHHHHLVVGQKDLNDLLLFATNYDGFGSEEEQAGGLGHVQSQLDAKGYPCHAAMIRDYGGLAAPSSGAQTGRTQVEQYATVGRKFFTG